MTPLIKWCLAFLVVGVLLSCLGLTLVLEVPIFLAIGWVLFLVHVLPQVEIDPGAWATGLVALAAFTAGLHGFLRWLASAVRSTAEPNSDQLSTTVDRDKPAWSLRLTATVAALLMVMFVAGISIVGITHQLTWLATSKEPLVAARGGEASRRITSTNHLHNIGVALHLHHDAHGQLPPGSSTDRDGRALHSWQTLILPYLGETTLYQSIDLSKTWSDPANAAPFKQALYFFLNPSVDANETDAAGFAVSHYAGNSYVLGGTQPMTWAGFKDGASKTILAGEAAGNFRPWGQPGNWRDPRLGINKSLDGFGGNRADATMFLIGDGSVKTFFDDIDPELFRALCTPIGGENHQMPE